MSTERKTQHMPSVHPHACCTMQMHRWYLYAACIRNQGSVQAFSVSLSGRPLVKTRNDSHMHMRMLQRYVSRASGTTASANRQPSSKMMIRQVEIKQPLSLTQRELWPQHCHRGVGHACTCAMQRTSAIRGYLQYRQYHEGWIVMMLSCKP